MFLNFPKANGSAIALSDSDQNLRVSKIQGYTYKHCIKASQCINYYLLYIGSFSKLHLFFLSYYLVPLSNDLQTPTSKILKWFNIAAQMSSLPPRPQLIYWGEMAQLLNEERAKREHQAWQSGINLIKLYSLLLFPYLHIYFITSFLSHIFLMPNKWIH